MGTNPWAMPQKRVELPPNKKLLPADLQMMETLEELEHGDQVDIFFEPNDETDYAVWLADGSVARIAQCYTINGVRWDVPPGRSKVPKAVYELMLQSEADAARAKNATIIPANKTICVGEMPKFRE